MYKVLVTGGIGSGKTTTCKIFKELGVPVFISDSKGNEALNTNQEVIKNIKELLGEEAYKDGVFDTKAVSDIIIENKEILPEVNKALEGVGLVSILSVVPEWDKSSVMRMIAFTVHPNVGGIFNSWCNEQDSDFVIEESSKAIKFGLADTFDFIIIVTADEELRIDRVMSRDNCPKEIAKARAYNRISDEERLKYADFVIVNNDSDDLESQVKSAYKKILENIKK
jgi:dephospho-CoA kinase